MEEEIRALKSYLKLECAMNKNLALEMALSFEKDVRHRSVETGCLQKFGAEIIKEEVRTTKEERTLLVTDEIREGEYHILVKIKETGKELGCPVYEIKGE